MGTELTRFHDIIERESRTMNYRIDTLNWLVAVAPCLQSSKESILAEIPSAQGGWREVLLTGESIYAVIVELWLDIND
jgi:hypothetical protein